MMPSPLCIATPPQTPPYLNPHPTNDRGPIRSLYNSVLVIRP